LLPVLLCDGVSFLVPQHPCSSPCPSFGRLTLAALAALVRLGNARQRRSPRSPFLAPRLSLTCATASVAPFPALPVPCAAPFLDRASTYVSTGLHAARLYGLVRHRLRTDRAGPPAAPLTGAL